MFDDLLSNDEDAPEELDLPCDLCGRPMIECDCDYDETTDEEWLDEHKDWLDGEESINEG